MEAEVFVVDRLARRQGQRNTILIKVERDATVLAAQIFWSVMIVLRTRLWMLSSNFAMKVGVMKREGWMLKEEGRQEDE